MDKKIVVKSCQGSCPYFKEGWNFFGNCTQVGINGKTIHKSDVCDKPIPDWCPLENNEVKS